MTDWTEATAAAQGRAIADGSLDPVDLTEAYLAKIDAHPLRDRIYARVTSERARAEAAAASRRAKLGQRRSALDGVPVSWKDLFDTAGVATEAGSALLKGRVPTEDAEVLKVATTLGLVCLGKTHMSELAFSGLGLNPVTATPPCVNDAAAVAGGSSSGAAASVAFGLAAAAIGSDTGGSVRIPSAWNDLVGLKTTSGRLSLSGVVPLAEKFDTVGPLCRTVEDAALVLAALEGRAPVDTRSPGSVEGMRFGVLRTIALDDLEDAPRAAFQSAVERLQAAGAVIEPVTCGTLDAAMADSAILFTSEAYGIWKDAIEADPDAMFGPIRDRFRSGADFGAADYVAAWRRLMDARRAWATRMAGFDAVLTPTCPILPPDHDRLMEQGDYYVRANLLALRNTRIGNLMGLCALTLPTGVPSCGVSLLGAAFGEERLLRIGLAAEAALS